MIGALLVVVDLQRIFATGPWAAPRFAEIVAPIRQLVDAHDDVVFTRFVAPTQPEGAWQTYYEVWPFARQPPDSPDYQLVDEFASFGSSTVDATTFGKWPALAAARDRPPGSDITVCGVSTDCCVLSTVLAAADAGMRVRVASDACAGIDDTSHDQALAVMALYAPLVEVVDTASVLGTSAETARTR